MPQRQPHHALKEFERTLRDCERLASDADRWSVTGSQPHISRRRADSMVEMAYLRGYLAWEVFLEDVFFLYSMGHVAPRGRPPRRYTFPPSLKILKTWIYDGRGHAKWDPDNVRTRAERFFRNSGPFDHLRTGSSRLGEAKTIRNAIAHESESARDKFETLARNEMGGSLPAGLTVGRFLSSIKPHSAPPKTFLEHYFRVIEGMAKQIVPT